MPSSLMDQGGTAAEGLNFLSVTNFDRHHQWHVLENRLITLVVLSSIMSEFALSADAQDDDWRTTVTEPYQGVTVQRCLVMGLTLGA
jgi:hypothetical protein